MVTITLYEIEPMPNKKNILSLLNGKKENGCMFHAKKYNGEIQIDVWYEEDIETGVKKVFTEDVYEVIEYLKEKGKEKILRKVYCFVDLRMKTLEIYRGLDAVTYKIKDSIENLLKVKLSPVSLDSKQLLKIVNKHSSELMQVMFKYIDGLWYQILRGRHLEGNNKYKNYLRRKPDSLRVVSVKPKIKFVNSSEYMVTINGDKGTIRMSNGLFKWKPRVEVKQIVSLVAGVAGLPSF